MSQIYHQIESTLALINGRYVLLASRFAATHFAGPASRGAACLRGQPTHCVAQLGPEIDQPPLSNKDFSKTYSGKTAILACVVTALQMRIQPWASRHGLVFDETRVSSITASGLAHNSLRRAYEELRQKNYYANWAFSMS